MRLCPFSPALPISAPDHSAQVRSNSSDPAACYGSVSLQRVERGGGVVGRADGSVPPGWFRGCWPLFFGCCEWFTTKKRVRNQASCTGALQGAKIGTLDLDQHKNSLEEFEEKQLLRPLNLHP